MLDSLLLPVSQVLEGWLLSFGLLRYLKTCDVSACGLKQIKK